MTGLRAEHHVDHVAGICSVNCEPTPDWVRGRRDGFTEGAREALTAAAAGIEDDARIIARFASNGMNAVGLVAELLRGRAAALDNAEGGAE